MVKKILTITAGLMLTLSNNAWATSDYHKKWHSDKYFICSTEIKNWPEIQKSGIYKPDSLDTEGFVHCTRASQMFFVANKFFNREHMILWLVDPTLLTAPVKYEGKLNSNLYPHIYGPLNVSAIIDTKEMMPSADGTYEIPSDFSSPYKQYNSRNYAICYINIDNWVEARLKGEYKPNDFDTLGYIPCLNPKDISKQSTYSFAKHIFVVVDLRKVESPVKREGQSNSDLHPNIYGPLNMDAVTDVVKLGRDTRFKR